MPSIKVEPFTYPRPAGLRRLGSISPVQKGSTQKCPGLFGLTVRIKIKYFLQGTGGGGIGGSPEFPPELNTAPCARRLWKANTNKPIKELILGKEKVLGDISLLLDINSYRKNEHQNILIMRII